MARILCVDDEPHVVTLKCAILEAAGHTVTASTSARDAMDKLQNNTYGLCEECGEEIDIKRLQVNPLARYCITCKTRKEEIERIQKEETRFKE